MGRSNGEQSFPFIYAAHGKPVSTRATEFSSYPICVGGGIRSLVGGGAVRRRGTSAMRDCNALRLCSSHRLIGYGMNVLSAAILVASYYAVVVLVWGPRILHGGPVSALAFVIVMVFHILLALSVWSYFMAVFSDPGSVPANWRPMIQDESLEMGNPVTSFDYVAPETRGPANSSSVGLERRPLGYCNHCRNGKPPRCHHCSV